MMPCLSGHEKLACGALLYRGVIGSNYVIAEVNEPWHWLP